MIKKTSFLLSICLFVFACVSTKPIDYNDVNAPTLPNKKLLPALKLDINYNYNSRDLGFLCGSGRKYINAIDNQGCSALIIVSSHCQVSMRYKVVGFLISQGIDTNIVDKDGKTALDYAAENKELISYINHII